MLFYCRKLRTGSPCPVPDFWHILAMFTDIGEMLLQLAAQAFDHMTGPFLQARHALDRLDGEVVAVELVQHCHVEGRRGRAFLNETSNMDVLMVGAFIGQPVDEVGVAVIGEDHRPLGGEHPVEILVGNPVRMLIL